MAAEEDATPVNAAAAATAAAAAAAASSLQLSSVMSHAEAGGQVRGHPHPGAGRGVLARVDGADADGWIRVAGLAVVAVAVAAAAVAPAAVDDHVNDGRVLGPVPAGQPEHLGGRGRMDELHFSDDNVELCVPKLGPL